MITNHPKTRMGDKVLNHLLVSQRALSKKKTISGADGLNDHKPPQNAHGRQGFKPTFGLPAASLRKKTISGADCLNDHKPPQNAHGKQGFKQTFGLPAASLRKKKQFRAPTA